jgi:hypothetical protein
MAAARYSRTMGSSGITVHANGVNAVDTPPRLDPSANRAQMPSSARRAAVIMRSAPLTYVSMAMVQVDAGRLERKFPAVDDQREPAVRGAPRPPRVEARWPGVDRAGAAAAAVPAPAASASPASPQGRRCSQPTGRPPPPLSCTFPSLVTPSTMDPVHVQPGPRRPPWPGRGAQEDRGWWASGRMWQSRWPLHSPDNSWSR